MAEVQLMLNVPEEQLQGASPDFFRAWSTQSAIVLDFCQQITEPTSGSDGLVVNATVAARVRVPYSQAFELMQSVNAQLAAHEAQAAAGPAGPVSPTSSAG